MAGPNIGKNYDKYIPRVSIAAGYNKRCRYPGCGVEPIFNYPIHKTGVYCKAHKLEGMEDVKNSKCGHKLGQDKYCTTRANYNYKGFGKGVYCCKHKLPGMMNVVYELCPGKGAPCGRIPQFNFAGEKHGKYCSKHADPGMRNVKKKTMQELLTELEEKILKSRYKMETNVQRLYESVQDKMKETDDENCESDTSSVVEIENPKKLLLDSDIKKENKTETKCHDTETKGHDTDNDTIEMDEEYEPNEDYNHLMERLIKYATLDQVETILMSRWKIEKYLYLLSKASNESIERVIAKKIIETL